MDLRAIRESSWEAAQRLGYPVNPDLPLLDAVDDIRPLEEVLDRTLVLYACVACSYGFPKVKALSWLKGEGLDKAVSGSEREYLESNDERKKPTFQWQVESLWALTWVAGYHESLDFSDSCSDDFIQLFPDLKSGAPSESFREKANPRDTESVVRTLDLSYCLHWAVREAQLRGETEPGPVPGLVVQERRRALEWVVGEENWDEVSLDT